MVESLSLDLNPRYEVFPTMLPRARLFFSAHPLFRADHTHEPSLDGLKDKKPHSCRMIVTLLCDLNRCRLCVQRDLL
jgi:hypothetical protein